MISTNSNSSRTAFDVSLPVARATRHEFQNGENTRRRDEYVWAFCTEARGEQADEFPTELQAVIVGPSRAHELRKGAHRQLCRGMMRTL